MDVSFSHGLSIYLLMFKIMPRGAARVLPATIGSHCVWHLDIVVSRQLDQCCFHLSALGFRRMVPASTGFSKTLTFFLRFLYACITMNAKIP